MWLCLRRDERDRLSFVFVITLSSHIVSVRIRNVLNDNENVGERRKNRTRTIIPLPVYFARRISLVNSVLRFKHKKDTKLAFIEMYFDVLSRCGYGWARHTPRVFIEFCGSERASGCAMRIWLNQSKHLAALNFLSSSTNLPRVHLRFDSTEFRRIDMRSMLPLPHARANYINDANYGLFMEAKRCADNQQWICCKTRTNLSNQAISK